MRAAPTTSVKASKICPDHSGTLPLTNRGKPSLIFDSSSRPFAPPATTFASSQMASVSCGAGSRRVSAARTPFLNAPAADPIVGA